MPHVSVVIPAYNAAPYLAAALESVFSQTFRDFEVLVVDDGSEDETPSLVAAYGSRVRYIRQPNAGVSTARNRGIEASEGHFIAFLDADDTWLPAKLEHQLAKLTEAPTFRACHTAHTVVAEDLRPLGVCRSERSGPLLEDLILRGNVIGSVSILCERSLFAEVGGFDPALSQCADWDMWIRLATRTDFLYLDEPLVTYRQHGSNMSRNPGLYERDVRLLLDKAFSMHLPAALRERRAEAWGRAYMVLAGSYFHARMYRDFLRCALLAVRLDRRRAAYLLTYPLRWYERRSRGPFDGLDG